MKKVSTVGAKQSKNFREQKLTIGLDLGDRSSWYCVLDEADMRKRTVKKSNCPIRPRDHGSPAIAPVIIRGSLPFPLFARVDRVWLISQGVLVRSGWVLNRRSFRPTEFAPTLSSLNRTEHIQVRWLEK